MYDTLHKIWIPATVVCVLPKDSYQVGTSNGLAYCCMRQHLHECSVKPTDTTPAVTTATLQTPARPHISVTPHAPAKPAKLPQPPPVAPATTATPKPQTAAVPEFAPVCAPTSATPSIAPVQPCRSGCAHTAPKYLIQELQPPFSPQEENPNLECPGLSHHLLCAPRQRTISLMHALYIRVNVSVEFVKKGGCCMIIRSFVCNTKRPSVKQSIKWQVSLNFQIYPGKTDEPSLHPSHLQLPELRVNSLLFNAVNEHPFETVK